MTNKEIAAAFNELAALMELHGENAYKVRSYQNAYRTLRKLDSPILEMDAAEWAGIKGVGKSIVAKLTELQETGTMHTLESYRSKTPLSIRDMLQIKGFGPKKIRVIWKDLGAETVGEVLYACNENRLIELKGFGAKTQEDLRKKLEYFLRSQGKYHYATLEAVAFELCEQIKTILPDTPVRLVGAMRRQLPVVENIELLLGADDTAMATLLGQQILSLSEQQAACYNCRTKDDFPVCVYTCAPDAFGSKVFRYSSSKAFIQAFLEQVAADDFRNIADEETVFEKAELPYIHPALREDAHFVDLAAQNKLPALVQATDICGVIHAHTTYSDGLHTLAEMATYARAQGYAYIGITDHSKSAFYAGGMKENEVLEQFAEIDQLNRQWDDFRIFKGIESDILNDGSLDYDDDLLSQFDFVIASVHSNLKMDKTKATARLITAIENPYTTILGHPTGRLLLSREGYPIDHVQVIDACAANGVCIELNANPYRLDIDWSWIPYALEKGVKIAINPDAHSKEGIHHIRYGVLAAQKGGLTAAMCPNTLSLEAFGAFLEHTK